MIVAVEFGDFPYFLKIRHFWETVKTLYNCLLSITLRPKNNPSKLVCNMYEHLLLYLQNKYHINSNQHNTDNIQTVEQPVSIPG